jgi:hypothetical protein
MLILNFSHPLTPDQLRQVEVLTGQAVVGVRHVPAQFNNQGGFVAQTVALADACDLTPEQWQTEPLLIVPPPYSFIAMTLLAELHGRTGYFPPFLRLRPVPDVVPTRFEVAEIVDLQGVRERARKTRTAAENV